MEEASNNDRDKLASFRELILMNMSIADPPILTVGNKTVIEEVRSQNRTVKTSITTFLIVVESWTLFCGKYLQIFVLAPIVSLYCGTLWVILVELSIE